MFKKILRVLLTVIGLTAGFFSGLALTKIEFIKNLGYLNNTLYFVLFLIFTTILLGLIFFLVSPWINKAIIRLMEQIEKYTQKLTATEVVFGAIGAILALIISYFVFSPLNRIPAVGPYLFVLVNITAGFIGADIAVKKKRRRNGITRRA